ncbi:hypothetical protein [Sphingomonas sp. BE137]|uniref:hypothetical protein n=1 Tax=Sphingomonas sp. BE137 TaxID=2817844 RepID=UPI001AE1E04D|nr:hypothetical protein [Sphingomonas sp. BE137]MDR6850371.1 hypothetical protein [Sphingomonas sp. BE137]
MSAVTRRAAIGLALGSAAVGVPSLALRPKPSAWESALARYRLTFARSTIEPSERNCDRFWEAHVALLAVAAPDIDAVQVKLRCVWDRDRQHDAVATDDEMDAILADLVRLGGSEVRP